MADDGREASVASRKRPSPFSDDEMEDAPRPAPPPPVPSNLKLHEPHKLRRLQEQHDLLLEEAEKQQHTSKTESDDNLARNGLRRALVLALDHVGFSSATDDALESFLLMTESYFHSMAEDIARFTLAGRRSQPIPLDFEATLPRFNIGTGALRPHLKNPIPRSKLTPELRHLQQCPAATAIIKTGTKGSVDGGDLPLLSQELSGRPEKEAKSYIPTGFPDFPSIHTYRHTPVDVDKVTVVGSGLRYDDGSLLLLPNEEASADDRELGLGGTAVGRGATGANNDPKRIREAAAVEAKQAEEALRGLMRASKVNKLKEVRAAADRNKLNKQRYTLWETAMQELIVDANGGKVPAVATVSAAAAIDLSPSRASKNAAAAAALREEIADQSMMVNCEKVFHRKEIPRKTRRVL
ncbi:bromodomain associated protein [Ophiostoma piceae UAMH 11346]|uniref:Transcription initiation factor TFIID subunit 8 n=1 Tax=Ophiostoma piceae (strain UAMH 11346) TaxID=1262450 RepID=S3CJM0_OPHP1|nr:bromodomain associated protein [Ophiostoma piceae UAMH 11346]